jgi:hypothetical protein
LQRGRGELSLSPSRLACGDLHHHLSFRTSLAEVREILPRPSDSVAYCSSSSPLTKARGSDFACDCYGSAIHEEVVEEVSNLDPPVFEEGVLHPC